MLRIGSLLLNSRQVQLMECHRNEVHAWVAGSRFVRRFPSQEEAERFLDRFQQEFNK